MSRAGCAWCRARRNLRGSRVCDECAAEWWWSENTTEDEADDGTEVSVVRWLWEPEPDAYRAGVRVAMLAERRWRTVPGPTYHPSVLWDTGTPSYAAA